MILFAIVGWALQHFGVVPGDSTTAVLLAMLIGMLVARFVPARAACPVRRPTE